MVYGVFDSCYGDCHVVGYFDNRDDAETVSYTHLLEYKLKIKNFSEDEIEKEIEKYEKSMDENIQWIIVYLSRILCNMTLDKRKIVYGLSLIHIYTEQVGTKRGKGQRQWKKKCIR